MGGDMSALVRTISKLPGLSKILGFPNRRMSHLEVAAKLIRLEVSDRDGSGNFTDLKKRHLDDLVKKNKKISDSEKNGLQKRIEKSVRIMDKVFHENDPLLNKQSFPQLYYGWLKDVTSSYASDDLNTRVRDFLEDFHKRRTENLQKPEEERDSVLIEYGLYMQQGTNDRQSMSRRAEILTRYLLLSNPHFQMVDTDRYFTDDERFVIWINGGKRCGKCTKSLKFDEVEADHVAAWSTGGKTSLENAQALCGPCNASKGAKK